MSRELVHAGLTASTVCSGWVGLLPYLPSHSWANGAKVALLTCGAAVTCTLRPERHPPASCSAVAAAHRSAWRLQRLAQRRLRPAGLPGTAAPRLAWRTRTCATRVVSAVLQTPTPSASLSSMPTNWAL